MLDGKINLLERWVEGWNDESRRETKCKEHKAQATTNGCCDKFAKVIYHKTLSERDR